MNLHIPFSLAVTRYLERSTDTSDLNLDVGTISFPSILHHHKERLVKLVSPVYLDDSKLAQIVDGRANIGWIYRKKWYAHPRASPNMDMSFPPINPDKGFYYVNAFESYISMMETECVAAHNVVRLLLNDFEYDEKLATLTDDYWRDTLN